MSPDDDTPSARRLKLLSDANDGVVAAAGTVQAFSAGRAIDSVLVLVGLAVLTAGAVAVGGHQYVESAAERDALIALVEAERARLAADPQAERDELVEIYERKGLSHALAEQVADELSARDPLAAQLDAEYRIDEITQAATPWLDGAWSMLGFAVGAVVPVLAATLVSFAWRGWVTLAVMVVALAVSARLAAVGGRRAVLWAIVRTVSIGVATMLVTTLAGSLLDLTAVRPEIDLDPFD